MLFESMADLVKVCQEKKLSMAEVILQQECAYHECETASIYQNMEEKLQVMEQALERGLSGVSSYSGLSGYGAQKLDLYSRSGRALCSGLFIQALRNAIAINEVNAAMGVICATPTAGSAGVVPAVLLAAREQLALSRQDQLNFLITAGGIGMIIGNHACLAGAEGGCQAEIGSASAMAAGALVAAVGADAQASSDAVAIALQNILGLVCDPVAGLVEIPCIKRNAMGASNALCAAELVLAGLHAEIPADEVIEAMGRVGASMPTTLRETALGGLAICPTALRYAKELAKSKKSLMPPESEKGNSF